MADPCFEDAIPFPISEDFSDGEMAITVNADIDAVPVGSYYLAKWMDFDGGLYSIKGIGNTTARWSFSVDAASARVQFSNTALLGTQEGVVYIPPGRQRIDVHLTQLYGPEGTGYIAFNLTKAGRLVYSSAAEGWVYALDPIPDAEVPSLDEVRLNYPVFTVLPNWENGISERLEWSTEIMTSETDIEQRRSLRRHARRSIEAAFLRTREQRARIDFFCVGTAKAPILVPLWFEQVILASDFDPLDANFALPAGESAMREFRVGDLVIIMGKSPDLYDLAEVADISSDVVTLDMVGDGHEWPAGSRVMPLRVARIEDEVTLDGVTDSVGRVSIRFELDEPETQFVDGEPPENDIFPWEPEWQASVEHRYSRLDYLFDAAYGRKALADIGQRTRVGTKFNLRLFGRQDLYDFRQFLGIKRGRAKRFSLPTFTSDLILTAPITGTTLTCKSSGFAKYMTVPQEARRTILVEKKDGTTPLLLQILACEEISPGIEVYDVDAYIEDVAVSNVKRIMFLMPMRFDQDAFEMNHYVDNAKVVEVSLVTRSTELANWSFVWPDDGSGGGPPPPPPEG